jgi:malonyl CoA-acyl carrier protein transacylase
MSKRLQVVFEDAEFEEVRRAAQSRGTTVSEWVRQTLRQARRGDASGDVEHRLAVVRAAARYDFPTADVETMLAEIEQGYTQS